MRLLATIEDPRVVAQILTHLGAAERAVTSRPRAAAARSREPLCGHAHLSVGLSALTRATVRCYVFDHARWLVGETRTTAAFMRAEECG
jgi:hypothetical protein